MENALSWVGAGAVAGALLLAAVTLALHRAGQDTGVIEEVGLAWFWACVLGGFVLVLGVRWKNVRAGEPPDAERGWHYALCLTGTAVLTALIAGNGALLGADSPAIDALSPTELRMAVVVCAVPLGVLLMLTVVRRPLLPPRSRSLPPFAAGAFAVALAGTSVPLVLVDEDQSGVRHVVAEDPPESAALPDRVNRSGWAWEPEPSGTIDRIVRGAHGPLVVLDDGVVSLDGTDGTEIWSYRDPAARDAAVWVGNGQVLFTRVPERDEDAAEHGGNAPEEQFTRVFDMVDGELVTEFSVDTGETSRGGARTLVGWSDGVRVHSDRRDGGEPDEAPGMSAWDAESGEELWYRDPGPEPGAACAGGPPRVRAETVVYAVACVDEEDLTDSTRQIESLIRDEEPDKRFRVVAVDLRTGEELWSYGLEGEEVFVPDRPWAVPGAEGRGSVIAVLGHYRSDPVLLLDPESGEELMYLSEDMVEAAEGFSQEAVIDVDGSGVTMLFSRSGEGSEVDRIDPDGHRTSLIGAGGAHVSRHSHRAVLPEQVVFAADESPETGDRAQVSVASHGELFGEGLRNRIVLETRANVGQLVAVPGGVAALVAEPYHQGARVEGLVP
ncbi:PQQ-binding-like beta-propeller repeat protein [Nocardiopsis metallicus]|uniref:Outer membrane protein assembly factor BamB n=1 Tax=Nocardiopsis metallicus TaxID=179819 RepID=A0A840WBI8_9ACTN|nr:PQQ-binding-like beta-propeller repeat protein [Nocardiopsis metallicus]MBB5489405.1 outer membrane protein assembly factor BamB [Nocardiopsis metallicus]